MVELPWPAGTKIPRWARGRRGRLREPDLQSHMQLDNLDRYHVALFRTSGLFPHVVEIIEPAGAGQGSRVTITTVWWPKDPLAAFQAAEAKYVGLSLYFDEHRN